MKKKILILFLLIMMPIKANALAGSTNITCDKTEVKPGESITCTLKGKIEDDKLLAYEGNIVPGTGITIVSVTPSNIWAQQDKGFPKIEYGGVSEDITGDFNITTIELKVDEGITTSTNTAITVAEQVIYGSVDTEGKQVNNANQNIKVLSTNNNLRALEISKGTLTPNFSVGTTNYTATIDAEKVTVAATPEDQTATVSGVGNIDLNYGTTTVKINVKSEANTNKEYTIVITRPDNRSTGSNLVAFDILGSNIEFDKSKTNYTINASNDIKELGICSEELEENTILCINANTIKIDDKAAITNATFNNKEINLNQTEGYTKLGDVNDGENILNIIITAENGDSKTYRFAILKNSSSSSNSENNNVINNTTSKGEISNPKTGSSFIYIVLAILAISIICIFVYYKKNEKNSKINEEKNEKK